MISHSLSPDELSEDVMEEDVCGPLQRGEGEGVVGRGDDLALALREGGRLVTQAKQDCILEQHSCKREQNKKKWKQGSGTELLKCLMKCKGCTKKTTKKN